MKFLLVTPVRLLGDGLSACVRGRTNLELIAVVRDLAALREALLAGVPDLVLIDATQGVDALDVREIAMQWPDVPLVALGLLEQRQQVIRCGRAGFVGYVSRDAGADALCGALEDVVAGRLTCSAEISGGLLRALFQARRDAVPDAQDALTRREGEVLALIGRGMSNKEIARELVLSVATVKHHVHHVLDKLKFQRRAQAMRHVRDAPWLGGQSHNAPEPVRFSD
ncbi:response regulator transcription factor [Variovorax sp. J31P179]|uniref:LuxR C-terminal-related transcriptional regulator n=1 Tax=Variovorax sp. J31P179 TaxID=3053508 RepID=UPI0025767AFB|nr:response regulator transcription factor [Variovorax sp. J31P179]MDM0085099.1 response regulator transcription factor [Variovorax sp. J31P179]